MAKSRSVTKTSTMFKLAVRAMRWSLSTPSARPPYMSSRRRKVVVDAAQREYLLERVDDHEVVPDDVKEGYFAVVAVHGDRPTRFVVSLRCLSNPMFLRLLELAEEEFGFRHEGALAIPCKPSELEMILGELKYGY